MDREIYNILIKIRDKWVITSQKQDEFHVQSHLDWDIPSTIHLPETIRKDEQIIDHHNDVTENESSEWEDIPPTVHLSKNSQNENLIQQSSSEKQPCANDSDWDIPPTRHLCENPMNQISVKNDDHQESTVYSNHQPSDHIDFTTETVMLYSNKQELKK